jgi:hypothetical protein
MFTRRSWGKALAAAVVVLGLLSPSVALSTSPEPAGSGERYGIPPGLRNSNPNFVEECGLLINMKSWPALEKFFTSEHPSGPGDKANSPDMAKVFKWHLVQLFNIPTEPCP